MSTDCEFRSVLQKWIFAVYGNKISDTCCEVNYHASSDLDATYTSKTVSELLVEMECDFNDYYHNSSDFIFKALEIFLYRTHSIMLHLINITN